MATQNVCASERRCRASGGAGLGVPGGGGGDVCTEGNRAFVGGFVTGVGVAADSRDDGRRLQRLFPDLLCVRVAHEPEYHHDRGELLDHAALKGEVGAPKACSSHTGVAVLLVHGVRLAGNGDGALLVLEALEGVCPRAQVPKQQRSHQPHIGTHFLRHLRERIVGRCEDRHPGRRVSKQLLAQARKRERIAKGDEAQAAHALLSRVLGWGRGMSTVCEL